MTPSTGGWSPTRAMFERWSASSQTSGESVAPRSCWCATAAAFVRARANPGGRDLEIDVIHESAPDIDAPPPPIDGVVVESLADLRAAKLTCLLSRSEPRDLVDLMFLDRAGFAPERDLPLALHKDAGIDPGVLAWLLGQFPVQPLPTMIVPLAAREVESFRDALRARLRRLAVPDPA